MFGIVYTNTILGCKVSNSFIKKLITVNSVASKKKKKTALNGYRVSCINKKWFFWEKLKILAFLKQLKKVFLFYSQTLLVFAKRAYKVIASK